MLTLFIQFTDLKPTYKPYTKVGPAVTRPVQDPLAETCLENQLYIWHLRDKHQLRDEYKW